MDKWWKMQEQKSLYDGWHRWHLYSHHNSQDAEETLNYYIPTQLKVGLF
jgi:hypothetical protein